MLGAGLAGGKQRAPRCFCFLIEERQNLLMPSALSAQRVNGAFAIVKAMRRESLGIIKERRIRSLKISAKNKEMFTIKHIGKIIPEQIFTLLLIIFTIL